MAGEKTEKATPKKRAKARDKGQVARSVELNGAVVVIAAVLALSAFGPGMLEHLQQAMVAVLGLVATPGVVTRAGLPSIAAQVTQHVGLALAPMLAACLVAGIAVNVAQVGFKPSKQALKPDFKRINPISGLKNLFSPNSAVEAGKGVAKVSIVGAVVALAVLPRMDEVSAMVGTPAAQLLPDLAHEALGIAQRAAGAYLAIALVDVFWQRKRFEKNLRMDKQEVKEELKQQDLPPEVKGALRRKAVEAARRRMMDAVPTADVVVTNPTHFSVALRYDASQLAPVVVAKGQDLVAFRIRELAREAGVLVVPDPPLARTLHASVEVGHMIPEELYHAVAQLLAYVYRVASRRPARTGAAA